jgi:hypothetical protein
MDYSGYFLNLTFTQFYEGDNGFNLSDILFSGQCVHSLRLFSLHIIEIKFNVLSFRRFWKVNCQNVQIFQI